MVLKKKPQESNSYSRSQLNERLRRMRTWRNLGSRKRIKAGKEIFDWSYGSDISQSDIREAESRLRREKYKTRDTMKKRKIEEKLDILDRLKKR